MNNTIWTPTKIAFTAIVAVIIIIFAFGSWTVVPPGHRGVRVTLGSVHKEALAEGVAFKWPLTSCVNLVTVKQGTTNSSAACFSKDLQTIEIHYAVLAHVNEGRVVDLYQKFSGDVYWSLIEPRVQEALKQVTAGYAAEEMATKRDEIRIKALAHIREQIGDYVTIVDLNILNIGLSDQLTHAIEAKMVQQQTALAKKFELEREQLQAQITVVQAKAEAEAVKIKGEALAQNPLVIELEVAKKWDGKSPATLVTGAAGGAGVVFPIGASASTRR